MTETVVPEQVLFLIMTIFAGGTVLIVLQSRYEALAKIPYTVAMFIYGLVVGVIIPFFLEDAASLLAEIPPRLIFHIFLPVLIFEGAYGMKIHALGQVIHQVVLLATVGLLINTVMLAGPAMLCFPDWTIYTAMLFGSLLSATDPVAVVSLLKGLGVDKRITALVDGEAIMNDGTAIITYSLFFPAAVAGSWTTPVTELVVIIVKCSVVAAVFGTFCGAVQAYALRRTSDGLVQACMTVAFTYVAYYVADVFIETSPVLVMFFQGTYLSTYFPSLFPGSSAHGHSVIATTWEFLVHLGNTVLFSLVGIIVMANLTFTWIDVIKIVIIYLAMMVGRFAMICMLLPLLNLRRFQLHTREAMLLTHGGLRGGVATALALGLFQTEEFTEGQDILKITAGVVGLTLLLNATTAAQVVNTLGLRKKPMHRMFQMQYAINFIKTEGLRQLAKSRGDATLQFADFGAVSSFVEDVTSPYAGAKVGEESEEVLVNMLLMNAFKSAIWQLRDEDSIPETSVRLLAEILSRCLFRRSLFTTEELVRECALPPLWFRVLRPTIESIKPLRKWSLEFSEKHQHHYFLMLLSCAEALAVVNHVKVQYVTNQASMQRVNRWIDGEKEKLQQEIDHFGQFMKRTRRHVATTRAARRSIRAMDHAVSDLHETHGFSVPVVSDLRRAVEGLKVQADMLCAVSSDAADEDVHAADPTAIAPGSLVETPHSMGEPVSSRSASAAGDVAAATAATAAPRGSISSAAAVVGADATSTSTSSSCVAALRGSVLGDKLQDDELRVLLGHSHLRTMAAGSTWSRQSDSSIFFLVVSGVVETAWDERGPSSVLHASYVLKYVAGAQAASRVMSPATTGSNSLLEFPSQNEAQSKGSAGVDALSAQNHYNKYFPSFFPPEFTAKTDVALLEFSFRDFLDVPRAANMSSLTGSDAPSTLFFMANTSFVGGIASQFVAASMSSMPSIINHFWRAVAAEVLLPYVVAQHQGTANAEAITPFLLCRSGIITIVRNDYDSVDVFEHRVSQDVYVVHGEDMSGMYVADGCPIPVPKTALAHIQWKAGTVLYTLDLPFFQSSMSSGMEGWLDGCEFVTSESKYFEYEASSPHFGGGGAEDAASLHAHRSESVAMVATWRDVMNDLLGNRNDLSAHTTPLNIPALNALHAALFCTVEKMTIAQFQLTKRLGEASELRAVVRACTDLAIRCVMDYCCRAEVILNDHQTYPTLFYKMRPEQEASDDFPLGRLKFTGGKGGAPSKQPAIYKVDRARLMIALRSLRSDVCMWTSSQMVMYGEQTLLSVKISKRIAGYLVDVVACASEEAATAEALPLSSPAPQPQ